MGLAVTVGTPEQVGQLDAEFENWLRSDLKDINDALKQEGHTGFAPSSADGEPADFEIGPYGFLHTLRRVAAHVAEGSPVPSPSDGDATDDAALERAYKQTGSGLASARKRSLLPWKRSFRFLPKSEFGHLLNHSDDEGYYVPVELPGPLAGDFTGEIVGSSIALCRELEVLRRKLGIPEEITPSSVALWEASDAQGEGDGWTRYGVESLVCVNLLGAARESVERKAPLIFQ